MREFSRISACSASSFTARTSSTQALASSHRRPGTACISGSRKRAGQFLSTPSGVAAFTRPAMAATGSSVSVCQTVSMSVSGTGNRRFMKKAWRPSARRYSANSRSNGSTYTPVR